MPMGAMGAMGLYHQGLQPAWGCRSLLRDERPQVTDIWCLGGLLEPDYGLGEAYESKGSSLAQPRGHAADHEHH